MVRFLSIGESLLMDMSPSLTMRICLKVLVASHLLLSLKVGEKQDASLIISLWGRSPSLLFNYLTLFTSLPWLL
jgi:hypothetical protein